MALFLIKKTNETGNENTVGWQPHPQGLYLLFIICLSKVPCSGSLKKVITSPGYKFGWIIFFNNKKPD